MPPAFTPYDQAQVLCRLVRCFCPHCQMGPFPEEDGPTHCHHCNAHFCSACFQLSGSEAESCLHAHLHFGDAADPAERRDIMRAYVKHRKLCQIGLFLCLVQTANARAEILDLLGHDFCDEHGISPEQLTEQALIEYQQRAAAAAATAADGRENVIAEGIAVQAPIDAVPVLEAIAAIYAEFHEVGPDAEAGDEEHHRQGDFEPDNDAAEGEAEPRPAPAANAGGRGYFPNWASVLFYPFRTPAPEAAASATTTTVTVIQRRRSDISMLFRKIWKNVNPKVSTERLKTIKKTVENSGSTLASSPASTLTASAASFGAAQASAVMGGVLITYDLVRWTTGILNPPPDMGVQLQKRVKNIVKDAVSSGGGAAIGTMICPGVGTAVGAALGGIAASFTHDEVD